MKPVNTLFATAALTLSLAALGATAARAAGVEVLNEGFDNVGALSGWALVNNSIPVGNAWFQGNPDIFPAQAGAPDAYAAVDFLSAANGGGNVDNWLITPVLDLKLEALELYQFDMRPEPHARSIRALENLARARGATVGVEAAEAFAALRIVQRA